MIYKSSSLGKTKFIAGIVARKVKRHIKGQKNTVVIGLMGDLGAGKTVFAREFLRHLGVKKRITSPTFVLIKRYRAKDHKAFHMDAYRLKSRRHLQALDFNKIIKDQKNIILIEWAEKIKKALPKNTIWIRFEHGKKETERKIILKNSI